jgi:HPt (histidine-containing phosphotransfer) domain-containing protein
VFQGGIFMGINKQAIMDAFGFDEDDVAMLVEVYFEGTDDSLSDLQSAISANDLEQISKAAHSIKGSSANIQLTDIADVACVLETAGRNGESIDYQGEFDKLNKMIEELKD